MEDAAGYRDVLSAAFGRTGVDRLYLRVTRALGAMAVLAALTAGCGGCTRVQGRHVPPGADARSRVVPARTAPQVLRPAQAIYASSGKIGTLVVQPGTRQRYLLLQEVVRSEASKDMRGQFGRKLQEAEAARIKGVPAAQAYQRFAPRESLVRLDIPSGKAEKLAEFPSANDQVRPMACARNGRVAVQERRPRTRRDLEYRINEWEPKGQWRVVTGWSAVAQYPLAWNPDSTRLLVQILGGASPSRLWPTVGVVTVAATKGAFAQPRLREEASTTARWSVDGKQLYCQRPRTPMLDDLISVAWPSQREMLLSAGIGVTEMSVAEESGDVVVLSPTSGRRVAVWRMRPGSRLKVTPVALPSWPVDAVVSPDGKYVAVVLAGNPESKPTVGEGGLVVYDLDDGSQRSVPGLVGKNVVRVSWALGGRALVFTVAPRGKMEWEALGKQIWLAHVR